MIAVAEALAILSLLLVVWSYLLYPAVIEQLSRRAPEASPRGGEPRSLEVILSAADEEDVIARRVENLLAQAAEAPLSISIGCDGCRDQTAKLAAAVLGGCGRVVEFRERRGKAAVLNDLVRGSAADVLVFTDANTRFEPGAVRRLAEEFDDPAVGAVCGRRPRIGGVREDVRDRVLGVGDGDQGSRRKTGSVPGRQWRDLRRPSSLDRASAGRDDPGRLSDSRADCRKGKRVVFAGDAVALEEAGRDAAAEVARRFRIGAGAGRILRQEPWLFNLRRHGLLSFAFFSRKAARWFAPVLALASAVATLGDPGLRPVGATVLTGAALLMLSVRARPRVPGFAGRLYDFCVINIALAAGVVAGLAGYRRPVWRRTR